MGSWGLKDRQGPNHRVYKAMRELELCFAVCGIEEGLSETQAGRQYQGEV